MSMRLGSPSLLGQIRREAPEVHEPRKQDRSLDRVVAIRDGRAEQSKHECVQARETWRAKRDELRENKLAWRAAVKEAEEFWKSAREEFFGMGITSGKFRMKKAQYEKMKAAAEQLHLSCKETAASCREKRNGFFGARQHMQERVRQLERLNLMRDVDRKANAMKEE